MTSKINRRSYLAGKAALVAAAATTGAGSAQAAVATVPTAPVSTDWRTVVAADLERFVGDRFRVKSERDGEVILQLVGLERQNFGADAPADLPRREGVVMIFESPDKAPLVATGDQSCQVRHPYLGTADLMLGPVRKRNGDSTIEIVLG